MFESEVDEIYHQYDFGSMQLSIVRKNGKWFLRYQYFSEGEVNKALHLYKDLSSDCNKIIQQIKNNSNEIRCTIKNKRNFIYIDMKKKQSLFEIKITSKYMGVIPISWHKAKAKQSTIISLLMGLADVTQNKSFQPDP